MSGPRCVLIVPFPSRRETRCRSLEWPVVGAASEMLMGALLLAPPSHYNVRIFIFASQTRPLELARVGRETPGSGFD